MSKQTLAQGPTMRLLVGVVLHNLVCHAFQIGCFGKGWLCWMHGQLHLTY
jgi:hypothetical protein